jgi:prophage regulatory protein
MNILSKKQVVKKIGLSPVTLWRMEKSGDFPHRIKLGTRRIGWREDDVNSWIESLPNVEGGKPCA